MGLLGILSVQPLLNPISPLLGREEIASVSICGSLDQNFLLTPEGGLLP
jgi:hypothetical protein